ncbi:MAG TPA: radical SAM protein [Anaerolineae bacterium]|nr:radical SAM protein [Anaerolineae bacterium]HQI85546.1 radical SAM protein [Anaerolineae bacterium]
MKLASVEITRRCNNRCPYCDQRKAEQDMSTALFARVLDDLTGVGVEAVALGGGEPTLHPALPALLEAVHQRRMSVGLTTNARDPGLVIGLAEQGLLDSFGVSADKGEWTALVAHPLAIVNLLLLRDTLPAVLRQAGAALRCGAHHLLLLGYKGADPTLRPPTAELAAAFSLLTGLGRAANVVVAADDYIRRRLALSETCGADFLRITLEGRREPCCFAACEYYESLV